MEHQRLVLDIAAGTSEYQPFTSEEEADHTERTRAVRQAEAALERRTALLASLAPSPALLQKARSGETPTSAEVWQCVRWLVLKDAPADSEPTQTEQDEREQTDAVRGFDEEDEGNGC